MLPLDCATVLAGAMVILAGRVSSFRFPLLLQVPGRLRPRAGERVLPGGTVSARPALHLVGGQERCCGRAVLLLAAT